MRGQVSMEYLLITGFSLLLLAPLLFLYQTQSIQVQSSFQQSQAQSATDTIAAAAQRVYYAGSPSQETVRITLPSGVQRFYTTNTSVDIEAKAPRSMDLFTVADVPLVPTDLPTTQGRFELVVRATPNGVSVSLP